jgi:hypothetical protein
MNDTLGRLQAWYGSHCNGSWEHTHGVRIDTVDNPGWSVKIDLQGTPLLARDLRPVVIDRSDGDWVRCDVANGIFQGWGGTTNLTEILDIFLRWADA